MSEPLISVIMSVYNERRYLAKAVESILSQTLEDFEFIIIDDGSTDGTTDLLKSYAAKDNRIRVIIQENHGLTKTLNTGLKLARGEFIARMDADDVSYPERFAKQVAAFNANPKLVMVGAEVELITEDSIRLGPRGHCQDHDGIRKRLLFGDGSAMTHPVIMFRRQPTLAVEGYDERFTTAQDLDLFLRLSEVGLVENLPETLLDWRQHAESINRNRSSTWRAMKALALKKTIERIGSKKFAEEFFRTEREFKFPESYLALGKLALRNRRYREAYRLFWRELRHGSDKRVAFDQILKIPLKHLWRKVFG